MQTKTKQEKRAAFRAMIEKRVRFANGYYYLGDYQPQTSTGRYPTKEAAIEYQMECYDMDPRNA